SSFSAALRCQQQRSEIMNTVSQFVNNFFTTSLRLRGSSSSATQASKDRPIHLASPFAPRCRQRERGVILGTSRSKRKGVRKINSKAPVRYRARGLLN
ncbi:hypothetical protein, partial [Burkholderia ubonensis]|uniref:hypothetical protein n=1 Tax=Burkholderia ubonensis TaxID=101571 RepID=UPI001C8A6DF2